MDPRQKELEAMLKRIESLSAEDVDLAKTNRRGLLLISQKMESVKKLIDEIESRDPGKAVHIIKPGELPI